MHQRLIELLICPTCGGALKLASVEAGERRPMSRTMSSLVEEVLEGVLECERCGVRYPVIGGVPRFVDGDARQSRDLLRESEAGDAKMEEANDYDNIRQSFSQEWSVFDYETDKTWGWTLEDRKQVFLGDVSLRPEELLDKNVLDAGCGNGTMTAALSDFGVNIVGLDLNDGLGRAYANRGRYSERALENVQYVQGNLVAPPFRKNTFDLIYSSGVIHHTPSSKRTFASLVGLTKKDGRLYVWVYGKRGWPVRLFFAMGRSLKRWISLQSVMRVCLLLSPCYKLAATLLNKLGGMKFRSRTAREITLDLFDLFAPRYNHCHTQGEVRSWFEEYGFRDIHVSGIQKHGFGMYGDKA
jgi:SAM-dependent methyltransferase/uncharacterized protein YbaR (Trm112 family)